MCRKMKGTQKKCQLQNTRKLLMVRDWAKLAVSILGLTARQLALTHFRSYFGKLYEYPPQYLRHTARPHLQPFKGKQRLYTAQEINGSLMGRSSVKHWEWIRGVKLRGTSVKFPFPNVCGDMFSISVDEANSDSDSDLLNHCTIVSRLD